MIDTMHQSLCPFSSGFQSAIDKFHAFTLDKKIAVIALTLIAGIASFFVLGMLAIPVFGWSVSLFEGSQTNPEDEVPVPLTSFANKSRDDEQDILSMTKEHPFLTYKKWTDSDLLDSTTRLAKFFRILSHPYWTKNDFHFNDFVLHVEQNFGNHPFGLSTFISKADIEQLKEIATFLVQGELIYQNEKRPDIKSQMQTLSFSHNANLGLLDAWIVRLREIT